MDSLTFPKYEIDKEAFREWLVSRPASGTFIPQDTCSCVIAQYIKDKENMIDNHVSVGRHGCTVRNKTYSFDQWVTKFIEKVDNVGGNIIKSRANKAIAKYPVDYNVAYANLAVLGVDYFFKEDTDNDQ